MSRRFATFNLFAILTAAAIALGTLAAPHRASAQAENAYDVLGKALVPIANVFAFTDATDSSGSDADGAGHGLVLDAHLVSASKLPPALQGQAVHVAVMTPGKILLTAPIAGQSMTLCRNGQDLWATPGSQIQAVLQDLAGLDAGKKKKLKKDHIFGPLVLPVPAKELVFLPILFQVADQGTETVAGQTCRVLDVQLMQQLAHSLHVEGWTARVWINATYAITQITLTGPDWTGTVAIDKLDLPPALPDSTFQPQGTDVLRLTPNQFADLLSQTGRK